MYKALGDYLSNKNLIFEKFERILPQELQTRKKINIFHSINLQHEYIAIFYLSQKSRFLIKNAKEIELLQERLKLLKNHDYKKKLIIIDAPLCSKAKSYLTALKWSVFNDSL